MEEEYNIYSIEELNIPANRIISLFDKHTIFLFNGDLGAGKTTLISIICKQLEVFNVSSPTFSIVNTYYNKKIGEMYHFDFYRIKDENEAIESGLDELLYSGKICFIEWSEKIYNLLPNDCVMIDISIKNNFHKIRIRT